MKAIGGGGKGKKREKGKKMISQDGLIKGSDIGQKDYTVE